MAQETRRFRGRLFLVVLIALGAWGYHAYHTQPQAKHWMDVGLVYGRSALAHGKAALQETLDQVPLAVANRATPVSGHEHHAAGPTQHPADVPATPSDFTYAGLPLAGRPLTVLYNEGFATGYDEARRNPAWVAYRLFKVDAAPAPERPNDFAVDLRTYTRVAADAFAKTGFDRGHMAPNYAIATRYGRAAQLMTFRMSNVCPQKPELNREVWRRLEMLVADDYANMLGEVWVVTGPVFDDEYTRRLPSGVEVPTAFYKIVLHDDRAGRISVLAFLVTQYVTGSESPAHFLTNVDQIEDKTGLDFFHELDDTLEAQLESLTPRQLWGEPARMARR